MGAAIALSQRRASRHRVWRHFVADCELEFGVPTLETSIGPRNDGGERAVLRDDADGCACVHAARGAP